MERTRVLGPVQAIAWNADCSSVAVSHCGNDVVIYESSSGAPGSGAAFTWTRTATLEGHHQPISGLDWAPNADLILSCSHDRNAFVWTRAGAAGPAASTSGARAAAPAASSVAMTAARFGGGAGSSQPATAAAPAVSATWEKQMVITRLTKGALCVRWSPSEAKFAIGSAARIVSVGYYDPESKWWACKLIRKAHESSVVSVAWHPNSLLLATGSTDRKVRLFNAYVPGYEPAAAPEAVPPGNFGDCLFEVTHEGCGWVHAVAWTLGDQAILYSSHDAVVGYVRGPQGQVAVRLSGACQLPLKCLAVVTERLAVGAGWDGCLLVLTRRSLQDQWQQAAVLGAPGSSSGGSPRSGDGGPLTPGSMPLAPASGPAPAATTSTPPGGVVRQLAQMHVSGGAGGAGSMSKAAVGSSAQGYHTACVTGLHVRPMAAASRGPGPRWHVASAGLDGQVVLWDLTAYL